MWSRIRSGSPVTIHSSWVALAVWDSMDISASREEKDRISELPDDILLKCLSSLEMINAAQTSVLSTRWRYLWTHLTILDFDPRVIFREEFDNFWDISKHETRKYFTWINRVVKLHQGPSIDKFRIRSRYVLIDDAEVDEWVKFAVSKRVKELVLEFNICCVVNGKRKKGYPLGFDILRHPSCFSDITALQSLQLKDVNVSTEFVEFLLSHCHQLERLYLQLTPLSNLKVKSSKLKYLTIAMCFSDWEELEIDAENLLYFEYLDANREGGPRMVFKSLPRLVETSFRGVFCHYPFPIFQQLYVFSAQLCKLSFEIEFDLWASYYCKLVIPDGAIPIFPNVKHFTCSTLCYPFSCILSMKRFIEACPSLEVFKLQVNESLNFRVRLCVPPCMVLEIIDGITPNRSRRCVILYGEVILLLILSHPETSPLSEHMVGYFLPQVENRTESRAFKEAIELQEIELEDEKENVETEIQENYNHNLVVGEVRDAAVENMNMGKQSHPNLRVLEVVGFFGGSADVQLALDVVSYACSLETIVCDTQGVGYSGTAYPFCSDSTDEYELAKRRARKLAKIVAPMVKVIIL